MVALRIALRYLFSKKSHGAVNVISIISVTGVALATLSIVCILSVFNGFSDLALKQGSVLAPDLRVESDGGKVIAAGDSLVGALRRLAGVKMVAPVIEERALAIYGNRQMPVRVKGVTDNYHSMTQIDRIVKSDGSFMLADSALGQFATLSVGVAITLDAHPGIDNAIALYMPQRTGRINPANPAASFRGDTLIVGGVYQTERADDDADGIIVPIDAVRRMLGYTDEATAIEVVTDPGANITHVADEVKRIVGPDYSVKNRMEQDADSFKMIAIEKWITFCMLAFILIIASFNVVSTLSMLVIEKEENINTLFALGASRALVTRIFVTEGWLIAVAGGVGGMIVGVALCLLQQHFGLITLGGNHDVMTTNIYPVRVALGDMAIVAALVTFVGLATSMLTALTARSRFILTLRQRV